MVETPDIYSVNHFDRECAHTHTHTHTESAAGGVADKAEGETGSPLIRETDVGLDPSAEGSRLTD